jgi:UDP-N-acetyl-D-glucosamine dehydrogenase
MNDSGENTPPVVGVIGLGYVGLPLSLQFAAAGVLVLGFDVDEAKVERLNSGVSYISHIPSSSVATARQTGRFSASSDFVRIGEVDAVLICVPTPLTKNREPDLSFVEQTARQIAKGLRAGMLVVLESTTYPGTTEEVLLPILESSGLKAGADFFLAYSPEREDPGSPERSAGKIPKVIGGLTPRCLSRAMEVYRTAIPSLVPVSSCRVAEATKLLENSFRGVNIALVNELKTVYAAMGIDIWEVIEAAKTKPFGFMPFYPGPGLGGHCIPIDPFYLTWKAREYEQNTRFIELAGEINTGMPHYVVDRVVMALNDAGKAVKGSRVLIVGIAYKPDVDDDRESPSYHLMDLLAERGARISYHDPFVPAIRPSREHARWAGLKSMQWSQSVISEQDVVIVATAHTTIDFQQLGQWAGCVVDTRNVIKSDARAKVWKA